MKKSSEKMDFIIGMTWMIFMVVFTTGLILNAQLWPEYLLGIMFFIVLVLSAVVFLFVFLPKTQGS